MKHIRRFLMAALMLVVSSAWAYDFEVDGIYYRIINNTEPYEVSVDRDSNNPSYSGDVVIPASVIYEGVEYSVTSIGSYAFYGCTGLTSVIIGNSVTRIGREAFYNTGIYNDNNNWEQGVLYIDRWLIKATESVNPDYEIMQDTRGIAEMAFYSCTGLTSIEIPNSVTSIGWSAFYGCTGLTSIEIPNSVTGIENEAFKGCTGLTSAIIGNSVTSIGNGAFSGCTGLTSIEIPNSVTSIGESAFRGCTGLTSVVIGNSVTSIGDSAFYECTSLTSIEIPNSVTSIGGSAFYFCTGLTSAIIGNSVTSIGGRAFYSCTGLNSIKVADDNPVYDSRNNCNAIIKTGSNEMIIGCNTTIIPNSVTGIGGSAFYGCTGLTSIEIPNSVTGIGWYAFRRCTGLTSVVIGNSVTSIGQGVFYGCTGLTSIEIPNSVTSIEPATFRDCTGLTSIEIPNSVTNIGGSAFSGCTGLTSAIIGNSVTSIGGRAFFRCTGLNSIKVADDNPVYDSRNNCNAIIKTGSNEMIIGCNTTIIPNSVTSIGEYAFCGCTGLTSIEIPNSVTNIGGSAFYSCTGLNSVTILANDPPTLGNGVFYDCGSDMTLYVPCGRKTAYSNSDWNRYFTNIIDTELIHDFMVRADDESHGSVLVTDCANQTVTVLAEPNEGYLFLNWTVNGQVVSRTNPYTFVVNEDIELVVNFTGTGVEEETAQAVSVSPNPAQDWVNVSCEEMQNISLFSTDGRRVKTINAMGANEMEIDLSGMAKGLYMIRIETQGGTAVNRKIVVK